MKASNKVTVARLARRTRRGRRVRRSDRTITKMQTDFGVMKREGTVSKGKGEAPQQNAKNIILTINATLILKVRDLMVF